MRESATPPAIGEKVTGDIHTARWLALISYPWNARDMYTLQSPLFNADKINTPILFLHGTADTNVPIGESSQDVYRIKIIGIAYSVVQVEGENHHILDYEKQYLVE